MVEHPSDQPDQQQNAGGFGTAIKRVMIIGPAGSGKSTVARMIGAKLNLPVFHIDREVYWLSGWVERNKADQMRQIDRIVAQDAWVFEGNNTISFAPREARADVLIWLDIPLWLRLIRIARRHGHPRPDMADGCVENLHSLPGFLLFVTKTSQKSKNQQGHFFRQSSLQKHRFTRTDAVNAFVESL